MEIKIRVAFEEAVPRCVPSRLCRQLADGAVVSLELSHVTDPGRTGRCDIDP